MLLLSSDQLGLGTGCGEACSQIFMVVGCFHCHGSRPNALPRSYLQATDHARQLVEKYVGKPFFDLPYARGEHAAASWTVTSGGSGVGQLLSGGGMLPKPDPVLPWATKLSPACHHCPRRRAAHE